MKKQHTLEKEKVLESFGFSDILIKIKSYDLSEKVKDFIDYFDLLGEWPKGSIPDYLSGDDAIARRVRMQSFICDSFIQAFSDCLLEIHDIRIQHPSINRNRVKEAIKSNYDKLFLSVIFGFDPCIIDRYPLYPESFFNECINEALSNEAEFERYVNRIAAGSNKVLPTRSADNYKKASPTQRAVPDIYVSSPALESVLKEYESRIPEWMDNWTKGKAKEYCGAFVLYLSDNKFFKNKGKKTAINFGLSRYGVDLSHVIHKLGQKRFEDLRERKTNKVRRAITGNYHGPL